MKTYGCLKFSAQAAVEERIAREHAGRPRAAEEVHVAPVDFAAGLLLAAVTDAEVDFAVLALGDDHARGNAVRLGALHRGVTGAGHRLDVDEVEELERVELALALAQPAGLEQLARPEGQLPADNAFVDAAGAGDLDRPDVRNPPGQGGIGDDALALARTRGLGDLDLRRRIAMLAELLDRGFPPGLHQRVVERPARL